MEEQIPPQEAPQQTPPPVVQNSNRNFIKYLGIGLSIVSFCIAIAVVGYLIFGINKNKTTPVSQTPPPTATATPTTDPTANWKTYTDTNLTFKYPPTVDIINGKDGSYTIGKNIDPKLPGAPSIDYIYILPINTKNTPTEQMHEITDAQILMSSLNVGETQNVKPKEPAVGFSPSWNYKRLTDSIVNGISSPAFTNDKVLGARPGSYEKRVYTRKGDYLYMFRAYMVGGVITEPLFDQILSTFKFTNSSASVGTGCKLGGCSNEICQNETDQGLVTTCIYKNEYACYKTAKCEVQLDGKCGWTQTEQLSSCLSK